MSVRPNFEIAAVSCFHMHPSELSIKDFSYTLPEERIAKFPLENRDDSKLLIYRDSHIKESNYRELASFLPPGALIVFNDTRVISARILFRKPEGGIIEIFLLAPVADTPGLSGPLQKQSTSTWKCLIGGASKWKPGYIPEINIDHHGTSISLRASIAARESDAFIVQFQWTPREKHFSEIVALVGQMPLPPYLKRSPVTGDRERYQTIFAKSEGSVAAPTAGLHFTPAILESLHQKKIHEIFLTLHVGAGTFKPVKAERMAGHTMHAEWMEIALETIQDLAENDAPVFAVGTTSLRTLESLYWMGVKCHQQPEIMIGDLEIKQWEVYGELIANITAETALTALADWMKKRQLNQLIVKTEILIAPGYRCKMIDGLITNFHQPQSTLLLLVAALAGDQWKDVYQYALDHDFRFLSYGDGCLIYTEKK